jgi:hypothetical protein
MTALKNIAEIIGNLWSRDLRPVDDGLDRDLQRLLEGEEFATTFTREGNIAFANLTGDENPLHRDPGYAKSFKIGGAEFTDNLVVGMYPASIGEQFSRRLLQELKSYWNGEGDDIKIFGQRTKIGNPIYPEDKISWGVADCREGSDHIELSLTGKVKRREVITITSRLGEHFGRMPALVAPIIQGSESKLATITSEKNSEFYKLLHMEPKEDVPNMFPASLVPRTMLGYIKAKTGRMDGLNLVTDFTFFDNPEVGEHQVDLYRPERIGRPRNGLHLYRMRATIASTRDSKPINYGELFVASPDELDFSPTV